MSRIDGLIKELCPDGVEFRALGEVGEFIRGRRFTKSDYVDSGLGSIHYGEIYTAYGTSTASVRRFVRPELEGRLRLARYGDLVIAATGESVEDVCKAVAWLGGEEVAVHDDCYIVSTRLRSTIHCLSSRPTRFVTEGQVGLGVEACEGVRCQPGKGCRSSASLGSAARDRGCSGYVEPARSRARSRGGWMRGVVNTSTSARSSFGSRRCRSRSSFQSGKVAGRDYPLRSQILPIGETGAPPWLASMDVSDTSAHAIRGRVTQVAMEDTPLRLVRRRGSRLSCGPIFSGGRSRGPHRGRYDSQSRRANPLAARRCRRRVRLPGASSG